MSKQTAVEWLVEQLPLIQQEGLRDVIEEAKAQEKEQIMNSWVLGFISYDNMTAEQYYNETYKKD